jgi:hypothetical protein
MVGLEHDLGAVWCHGHGLVVADGLGDPVKAGASVVPYIQPYWQSWFRRHGSGRFKLIDGDGRGCAFYCAKYSAKRGEVYFSSGLEGFRGHAPRERVTLFPEQQSLVGGAGLHEPEAPPE